MTRGAPIPETVTLHVPFRVVKRGGRKEMQMPEGATLVTDGETLVVNITEQISAEALEAELAEAEAEAGIEQDEPETDETEGAPSDKQLAEGDAPMESPEDGNKDD